MSEDWIKFKKYPHIGFPYSKKDIPWIKGYVTNADKIVQHKFTPFLHKTIKTRRYRPIEEIALPGVPRKKNDYGKRDREAKKEKERLIFYASHLDTLVYSYYSSILLDNYEKFIAGKNFNGAAVAYRRIPVCSDDPENTANKSNIEFAKEAILFIEENKKEDLSVIVADITSFFDNLDHRILHFHWKKVLGVENLSEDHYKVYKSLLRRFYVNENEIYNRFKDRLWVERAEPNNPKKLVRKKKAVKKRKYLKEERVIAYCEKVEFFQKHHNLIRGGKMKKGIPQGTAISATLANIYMLSFDQEVQNEISKRKGFYQRYSDDMILVCKREDENYFLDLIRDSIVKVKLDIQPEKTKVYRYSPLEDRMVGGLVVEGAVNPNYQLEYLGFKYDGHKVYIKTSGFSKFYRGLKRSIARGTYFASCSTNPNRNLYKTRLYKRFTPKGAKRRLIWKPDPQNPKKYKETKFQDWGNYYSYIYKADKAFTDINEGPVIKNQGRKIWAKFHQEIDDAEREISRKRSLTKGRRIYSG